MARHGVPPTPKNERRVRRHHERTGAARLGGLAAAHRPGRWGWGGARRVLAGRGGNGPVDGGTAGLMDGWPSPAIERLPGSRSPPSVAGGLQPPTGSARVHPALRLSRVACGRSSTLATVPSSHLPAGDHRHPRGGFSRLRPQNIATALAPGHRRLAGTRGCRRPRGLETGGRDPRPLPGTPIPAGMGIPRTAVSAPLPRVFFCIIRVRNPGSVRARRSTCCDAWCNSGIPPRLSSSPASVDTSNRDQPRLWPTHPSRAPSPGIFWSRPCATSGCPCIVAPSIPCNRDPSTAPGGISPGSSTVSSPQR